MDDIDFTCFLELKTRIQNEYLKNNTPSNDDISQWKGIDIIYFQEELRKKAKGSISEKTFYTYFKSSQINKLPRIDMLNLLSVYVGYESWYDFKKQIIPSNKHTEHLEQNTPKEIIEENKNTHIRGKNIFQQYKIFFLSTVTLLVVLVLSIVLSDYFLKKTYRFCFTDADRGISIKSPINIKLIKENESPLHYKVTDGKCFEITTKDKILKMEVSTPLYEKIEIYRNLDNALEIENISLKPDDYAIMLYYYSTKDTNNSSLESIKNKQQKLNHLISDNALIYQVFDNEIYGIETLSKQKYIGLVTTPTKSLQNLKVLNTKIENGKITSIKFKIETNEHK